VNVAVTDRGCYDGGVLEQKPAGRDSVQMDAKSKEDKEVEEIALLQSLLEIRMPSEEKRRITEVPAVK
jgi:hypothetical protein